MKVYIFIFFYFICSIAKANTTVNGNCVNYSSLEVPKGIYKVDIVADIEIDKLKVCSIKDKKIISAYSSIENTEICSFKFQKLDIRKNKWIGNNNPIYELYSPKIDFSCTLMEGTYFDLTNVHEYFSKIKTVNILRDFLIQMKNKDIREYIGVSYWDRFFDSNYNSFIASLTEANEIKISSLSKYLLDERKSIHLLNIYIDGVPWSLLVELTHKNLIITHVSKSI